MRSALDAEAAALDRADVPEYVLRWVSQLLEPRTLDLLRLGEAGQVDVRLSAKDGRVRRRPVVAFDAGPQEFEPPS